MLQWVDWGGGSDQMDSISWSQHPSPNLIPKIPNILVSNSFLGLLWNNKIKRCTVQTLIHIKLVYKLLSKTCTSTLGWPSVSLQLLTPHDQTPNESWPRAWVEWSPGHGASHCTGPRGCSILTWVMTGDGQIDADGHSNSLGDGFRFPYNKSPGSRLCRVSHGILKGIRWSAVDLHGFGMFQGPMLWFRAVIHRLKHDWLHPCHPRSKHIAVPQTLGIFSNFLGFPLPKWVSRRFSQNTS